MAEMMEVPIVGLVENMSYASCPDCGKKLYLAGICNCFSGQKEVYLPNFPGAFLCGIDKKPQKPHHGTAIMQELKDRIVKEGKVLPGNIIKVDGFLNHRVDTVLLDHIAEEFGRHFNMDDVTVILTAEASGIGAFLCGIDKKPQKPHHGQAWRGFSYSALYFPQAHDLRQESQKRQH